MKYRFIIINSLFWISSLMLNAVEPVKTESPNILFILTDDQGWSQVSKPMHPEIPESGSQYLSTPNIDRLADSGIRFTNGYAPAPLCTPTRRSILCGTSAARSGTEFKSKFVPADFVTIPKALKQANPAYFCAHFGKWGEHMISSPEECGYDKSDGHTGNVTGGMPKSLGVAGGHMDGPPYFINNQDPKRTTSVTESAIKFIRRSVEKNRPFYVQVSYYAVHLSIVCKEETLVKYKLKGKPDRGYPQAWTAMLDELDQGIGQLLEVLDELRITDNTYVFFMSDNGGQENPMPGKNEKSLPVNYPLLGSKHSLLEGGIRVPFIVRGPGIQSGVYSHVPVVGYDLLPTFYDIAGGKKPLSDEIDGGSIRPLFDHPINGEVDRPLDGLIFDRRSPRFLSSAILSSAIRQGEYKLFVRWNRQGEIQSSVLYNLDANILENKDTDIAESKGEKADHLQNILLNYLQSVNDPSNQ